MSPARLATLRRPSKNRVKPARRRLASRPVVHAIMIKPNGAPRRKRVIGGAMEQARRIGQSGLRPPFEAIEPARLASPLVFNSPHSGSRYPAALPRRLAARPADAAPLRGRLRRRIVPALRRARRAVAAGALSARLPRPQSRAVRARPADVRRAAARFRQHPLAARRGRARHDPARRRRRPADLPRPMSVADALARIAVAAPALSRAAGGPDRAHAGALRRGDPARLPFDALDAAESAALDIVLGDRFGASAAPWVVEALEIGAAGARLSRSPQQALRRRLHHRALRRARAKAATPCRSRSIAPFTWTSADREADRAAGLAKSVRRRRRRGARARRRARSAEPRAADAGRRSDGAMLDAREPTCADRIRTGAA